MLIPNDEVVAVAWLQAAVTGLSGKVATSLPDTPWNADNEFVQVMQVGGTPDVHLPILEPVISVNCFAMVPGSTKPPWNQANQLAMRIWKATQVIRFGTSAAVLLDLAGAYGNALVRTVTTVAQPRRIPSDPSQFAVYNLDLLFSWVPAQEVFT